MFDLTSSKLLILGVVALIVVGPKELPFLLRTIGKYMAMVRRHANEFRSQFDEAMREAELDTIKKDIEKVARDTENTLRESTSNAERDLQSTFQDIDKSVTSAGASTGSPVANSDAAEQASTAVASNDHGDAALSADAGGEVVAGSELAVLADHPIETKTEATAPDTTLGPVPEMIVDAPIERATADSSAAVQPHLVKTGT